MRRAIFAAAAAAALLLMSQSAFSYHVPRQLPWLVGEQYYISGNTKGCDSHDDLTETEFGHFNAGYYAIDFGIGYGENVSSVAAGLVAYRNNNQDGYGYKVVLDHGGGVYSIYAHFGSDDNPDDPRFAVEEGAFIPQGRVVGYAGDSGGPYDPHLHFHMQSGVSAMVPSDLSGYIDFFQYGYSIDNDCEWNGSPLYTSSQPETDGDNYLDNTENYLGTSVFFACPSTLYRDDEPVDRWPPDFDDNRSVNILDVIQLTPPVYGTVGTPQTHPAIFPRLDLAPSRSIGVLDIVLLTPPVSRNNLLAISHLRLV